MNLLLKTKRNKKTNLDEKLKGRKKSKTDSEDYEKNSMPSFLPAYLATYALLFFLLVGIPYLNVETTTFLKKEEFPTLEEDLSMVDEIEYFKVRDFSQHYAELLCVTKNHESTILCWYEKNGDTWEFKSSAYVRSEAEGVDDFFWPYYR